MRALHSDCPGSQQWFWHSLAVQTWASYFNFLSLGFLTSQLVVPTKQEIVRLKREDAGKARGLAPGRYEVIQNLSKVLMLVGVGGLGEFGG